MIPVHDLFESHLNVADLQRSMSFFGQTLGLELAEVFWDRRVAFYWICGRGNAMLGLWEVGDRPLGPGLHIAFRANLPDLLDAAARLRAADVVPLDFWGQPTDEPVVLGWMPAASLYFRDPDGHMLELLSMLPDSPQPELGIVGWSRWNQVRESCKGAGSVSAKITDALVHLSAIVRLLPYRLDRKALFIELKCPRDLANAGHSLVMESSCGA